MVSFEVRRVRSAALVLAFVAWLPGSALSQQEPGVDDERRIIAERIERALAQGGPYSEDLIDPLAILVELYRESGNHDLAAAATDQAMQVIRANYGLRSLDQAPLIRERIQSEEDRGNFAEAWHLEQALLTLAGANPRDPRSAEIFGEIGDKRLEVLRRFDAGEFPPQIVFGCYYRKPEDVPRINEAYVGGSCTSGSRRVARRWLLVDVQRNYAAGVGVLLRGGQYSSAELRGLELDLVRSTYLYGGNYETGRQSLRRLITYDVANDAPLDVRADALLQIADWDLLYEHRSLALETYEATYEFLKRGGVDAAAIDALFSPEIPVMLPGFWNNPLVTLPSGEYIDVSFEITRDGLSERVKVLTKTANFSEDAEDRLARLVERGRFRPRVVDGELARSAPVVVRYYLND